MLAHYVEAADNYTYSITLTSSAYDQRSAGHRCSLQLKDWTCDNMLTDQGNHKPHGVQNGGVTSDGENLLKW